jgi:hypothetical protein
LSAVLNRGVVVIVIIIAAVYFNLRNYIHCVESLRKEWGVGSEMPLSGTGNNDVVNTEICNEKPYYILTELELLFCCVVGEDNFLNR